MKEHDKNTVLVCSRDPGMIEALCSPLQQAGLRTLLAASSQEAERLLKQRSIDLVVVDSQPQRISALRDLVTHHQSFAMLPIVILCQSDYSPSALRQGGFLDVTPLAKPVNARTYVRVIKRLLGVEKRSEDTELLEQGMSRPWVCKSEAMLALVERMKCIAAVPYPVLIQAPKGAEVESVARVHHEHSPQAQLPFLAIACDRCTESDLDGIFRSLQSQVNGQSTPLVTHLYGTVFFQDIAALPRQYQTRLESVLSMQQGFPAGSPQVVPRVIASSSRELWEAVTDGTFYNGLYYALTSCTVIVPPLIRRHEDIPDLVKALVAKHSHIQRKSRVIDESTVARLVALQWPGDVAELESAIISAVIHSCSNTLRDEDFSTLAPPSSPASPPSVGIPSDVFPWLPTNQSEVRPLKGVLTHVERAYVKATIHVFGGDKERAAKSLGISLATVYRKMLFEDDPGVGRVRSSG